MNQIIDIKLGLKAPVDENRKLAWIKKTDEERSNARASALIEIEKQLVKAFEDFEVVGLDITVFMDDILS